MTEKTELLGYAATVEAIIFASDKPVRERELRHHIPDEQDMAEIIEMIRQRFDANCGIELRQVGDGWAFRTRAKIAERLNQQKQVERPLSRAALEVVNAPRPSKASQRHVLEVRFRRRVGSAKTAE